MCIAGPPRQGPSAATLQATARRNNNAPMMKLHWNSLSKDKISEKSIWVQYSLCFISPLFVRNIFCVVGVLTAFRRQRRFCGPCGTRDGTSGICVLQIQRACASQMCSQENQRGFHQLGEMSIQFMFSVPSSVCHVFEFHTRWTPEERTMFALVWRNSKSSIHMKF